MINRILTDAKEDAKKSCEFNEIYLIEPVQRPIEYAGRYPFGDPALLPPISCIAELWYCFPVRNMEKDFSSLGLIWFQGDYAFPIDEEILGIIKQIPFSKICGEFSY